MKQGMEALFCRRSLLKLLGVGLPGLSRGADEKLPPVRAITRGPKYHWFGYYDKLQFDPTGRYVLGMEVDFRDRQPTPDDVIKVGMVDLRDNDRWIELGESRAWSWQQGCMLQWLPRSGSQIVWNDRQGDRFVCHILDVHTRKKRTLPSPIYAVSPDSRWAVTPDFRRLHDCRPGYGYAGVADPNKGDLAPKNAGIWWMDLNTGKQRLIISFADALKFPYREGDWSRAKHWYNHLLVSPDGRRFIFFHRWNTKPTEDLDFYKVLRTRMFTANPDGSGIYLLDPHGGTSHFIWRDPKHVLAWARHPSNPKSQFYLFEDQTEQVQIVGAGVLPPGGHVSYLPGKRWILTDTYPDKQRNQTPCVYDTQTGKLYSLAHFYSAPEYWSARPHAPWRCDLHPRFSPDGRKVVVDSTHEGGGRQMYLIDIIVGDPRSL